MPKEDQCGSEWITEYLFFGPVERMSDYLEARKVLISEVSGMRIRGSLR